MKRNPYFRFIGDTKLDNKMPVGSRRSRLEIMADILQEGRKPTRKTQIMYQCNLSFKQFKTYLSFLGIKGLIKGKDNSGAALYQTTRSGLSFLKLYRKMVLLLLQ